MPTEDSHTLPDSGNGSVLELPEEIEEVPATPVETSIPIVNQEPKPVVDQSEPEQSVDETPVEEVEEEDDYEEEVEEDNGNGASLPEQNQSEVVESEPVVEP